MLRHDVDAPSNCLKYTVGALSNTPAGAGANVFGDITRMAFGAQVSGALPGDVECPLIVCLNQLPTAGEDTAFRAWCVSEFGVAA